MMVVRALLVAVAALVGWPVWFAAPAAAEVLRAAYEDRALPPYYLGDSADIDAAAPGISIELMRMTAKAAGVEVHFVRMPWVRCLSALQRGEVDAIFNASFNPDRMANGVYPMSGGHPDAARRIATVAYSLYAPKDGGLGWNGSTVTGLGDRTVGAPAGYSIIDDLVKAGVKVETAPDSVANFRKLASGRIAAVATLDTAGDALLASGRFPQLAKVAPPLVTKNYFVMFSHQFYDSHQALAERLWTNLAEMRDSKGGELVAKYTK